MEMGGTSLTQRVIQVTYQSVEGLVRTALNEPKAYRIGDSAGNYYRVVIPEGEYRGMHGELIALERLGHYKNELWRIKK